MRVDIDYARAQERHPDLVAALVQDMNRKLRRAKMDEIAPEDGVWSYEWSVCITSAIVTSDLPILGPAPTRKATEDPLDNCIVGLRLAIGRKASSQFLVQGPENAPAVMTPRSQVPPEVAAAYEPKPTIEQETFPHIEAVPVFNPNLAETNSVLVTGGYRNRKGDIHILAVKVGSDVQPGVRPLEILYRIDGDQAIWSGGLVPAAQRRFDATEEGGVFRYRNKPLTRLTAAEIRNLVRGRKLTLSSP